MYFPKSSITLKTIFAEWRSIGVTPNLIDAPRMDRVHDEDPDLGPMVSGLGSGSRRSSSTNRTGCAGRKICSDRRHSPHLIRRATGGGGMASCGVSVRSIAMIPSSIMRACQRRAVSVGMS
jgi:hypothetical protein